MNDPAEIRAWQRLSPDVTTSGRITAQDIDALAALGVRHVANLALASHPEALADEADVLASRGIGYTHIPVPFDAPQESHYARFCAAMAAAPRPLHVHCIMNWRVSAFFYRWHIDQGMAADGAKAVMERQWNPESTDHLDAPVWSDFIKGGS